MQTLRVIESTDHQKEAIAIELLRRNARAVILRSTGLSARRLHSLAEKVGVKYGGTTRGPIPQVAQTYDTEEARLHVRTFAPVYIKFAKDPRVAQDIQAIIYSHDLCHQFLGVPIHIDNCWTMARDIRNGNIYRIECTNCSCAYFGLETNTQQRCPMCRVAGDGKIFPDPKKVYTRASVPSGRQRGA